MKTIRNEFDYRVMIAETIQHTGGIAGVNEYVCSKCRHVRVTCDLDAGVTPMFDMCDQMIDGEKCGGRMDSRGYQVNQNQIWTHEWYRPDYDEFKRMPRGTDVERATIDHVTQGGLLFRKRDDRALRRHRDFVAHIDAGLCRLNIDLDGRELPDGEWCSEKGDIPTLFPADWDGDLSLGDKIPVCIQHSSLVAMRKAMINAGRNTKKKQGMASAARVQANPNVPDGVVVAIDPARPDTAKAIHVADDSKRETL